MWGCAWGRTLHAPHRTHLIAQHCLSARDAPCLQELPAGVAHAQSRTVTLALRGGGKGESAHAPRQCSTRAHAHKYTTASGLWLLAFGTRRGSYGWWLTASVCPSARPCLVPATQWACATVDAACVAAPATDIVPLYKCCCGSLLPTCMCTRGHEHRVARDVGTMALARARVHECAAGAVGESLARVLSAGFLFVPAPVSTCRSAHLALLHSWWTAHVGRARTWAAVMPRAATMRAHAAHPSCCRHCGSPALLQQRGAPLRRRLGGCTWLCGLRGQHSCRNGACKVSLCPLCVTVTRVQPPVCVSHASPALKPAMRSHGWLAARQLRHGSPASTLQ